MKNILVFIKNHFVEVVGFAIIFVLIVLISYLKYFRKTFNCSLEKNVDGIKIKESYVIKQKNNSINTITYKYTADLTGVKNKTLIQGTYQQMMSGIDDNTFGKRPKLVYEGNKIKLSYELDRSDIKGKKAYKSARVFLKNIKASGFKCN